MGVNLNTAATQFGVGSIWTSLSVCAGHFSYEFLVNIQLSFMFFEYLNILGMFGKKNSVWKSVVVNIQLSAVKLPWIRVSSALLLGASGEKNVLKYQSC